MSEVDGALFAENERTAAVLHGRQTHQIPDFSTECGFSFESINIAYELFGSPNADKSNAILVCHAISGDSHCIGWWDRLIGPGRAIDTDRYWVIGTNVIGGCQGSTGPSSLAPDGKPYGSRFPQITVGDMVEAQSRLMDFLGIDTLHCVAGGSMGGMQALEWTVRFPGRVRNCFMTASSNAHSAMQIGFNETARQAIKRDPKWQGGDYPLEDPPKAGLSVARMLGHLSYLSEESFERKFGRELQRGPGSEFQVESYLRHQGDKFVDRFDANSFVVLSNAIDRYHCESLTQSRSEYLIVSYSSDWLYPTYQSVRVEQLAHAAGCSAKRAEIDLPFGHDSFLIDGELQGQFVKEFIKM